MSEMMYFFIAASRYEASFRCLNHQDRQ